MPKCSHFYSDIWGYDQIEDRVQMMSDEMLTVGFAWLWFLCGLCFGFWWLFDENIDG